MYYGSMTDPNTVTLSIKNVPADVARRLKARAERNHRSLQGELMAIVEEASRELSVEDLAAFASRVGLRTPAEATRFVRADRDRRDGRDGRRR
jgi:plasmid stability protein